MQNETITVKFDGQDHQVDLDTFTSVLLNYSTVVRAAADELGVNGDTRVAICAIESGSLDVVVSILTDGLGGLIDFITNNKEPLVAVLALTAGLYELKQKLAGKGKVERIDTDGDGNQVIVTEKGNVYAPKQVVNVYVNHPEATIAIDRSFSQLDEHPEISAFQLSKGDEIMFRAEHEEFPDIASSSNYVHETVRHQTVMANLNVMKPFLGASKTRKWEFYYEGNKISASIDDDDFIESMSAYSFTVGTTMRAELDIEQELLEEYNIWANRSYRVVRVESIDNPPQEEPLL